MEKERATSRARSRSPREHRHSPSIYRRSSSRIRSCTRRERVNHTGVSDGDNANIDGPSRDSTKRRRRSGSGRSRISRSPLEDHGRGSVHDDRSLRDSASYGTPDRRRSTSVDHSLYGVATNLLDVDRGPGGATNVLNNDDLNRVGDQRANTPPLIIHNDVDLPTEVLNLIGEDPDGTKVNGYTLHQALTARWSKILSSGLSKEKKEQLIAKCCVPDNCKTLIPPLVNKEIVPCLSGAYIKRDSCYVNFQDQLGRGLASLGKGIDAVLEKGQDISPNLREKILPSLTEAGQIFSNLFFDISQTRRTLILPMLSKSVKEVVETSVPGEYLFGDGLAEKVKEAKILEKTAKDLRPQAVFSAPKKGGGVWLLADHRHRDHTIVTEQVQLVL